jgi:hypothetical protein
MYLVISTGHKTPQYIHPICITARIRMFRLIADKLGTDKVPCRSRRLIADKLGTDKVPCLPRRLIADKELIKSLVYLED